MYVDESGDSGLANSPTQYFALSGIVVHESSWRDFINALIQLRKVLRSVHGLPIRREIHASEFVNKRAFNLDRHVRLAILRNTVDELAKLNYISITNVIVDKQGKPQNYDVFGAAWGTLFQRFENTLIHGNFPGGHRDDHGMVITDATSGKKLTRLMRKMAVYNYIPNDARFGAGPETSRSNGLLKIHTKRTRGRHCQFRCAMSSHISCFRDSRRTHTYVGNVPAPILIALPPYSINGRAASIA